MQMLTQKAALFKEEQVRKEIRARQMARLNLDMYSFDLPAAYEPPTAKEKVSGKHIGTWSKDYAGTAPAQRRTAAQSTAMVSSASGAGGREGEEEGSEEASPSKFGRSEIASAAEKDDSRS